MVCREVEFGRVRILRVMNVLGLTPSKTMQCLGPPSDMVQGGVKQLFIVQSIPMAMWSEGKEE